MDGLLVLLVAVAVVGLLDVAAVLYGSDSRECDRVAGDPAD